MAECRNEKTPPGNRAASSATRGRSFNESSDELSFVHCRNAAWLIGVAHSCRRYHQPGTTVHAQTASKKPNILFIMGDDIGRMQPSIYHRGLMVGETPNIDRIGNEGAIFTDYVAMILT
jgi:hypothetical protein